MTKPTKVMRILIQKPDKSYMEFSADKEVLAKPGVTEMWDTICTEASAFVAKRYNELNAERKAASARPVVERQGVDRG